VVRKLAGITVQLFCLEDSVIEDRSLLKKTFFYMLHVLRRGRLVFHLYVFVVDLKVCLRCVVLDVEIVVGCIM